jgi:hypothetical protein
MPANLRAQFDGADQAESAVRLLRSNGIEPIDFTVRTPSKSYAGHTSEYRTMTPPPYDTEAGADMHHDAGQGPLIGGEAAAAGLVGAAGVMGMTGMMGMDAGLAGGAILFPVGMNMLCQNADASADAGGNPTVVELLVSVDESDSHEARSLLRSAHGWRVH